jgi:uncharacterized protein (TIGR00251 family)
MVGGVAPLKLTTDRNGVLLPVRVKTRAKRRGIDEVRMGALVIAVQAPPIDGAANAAVIEILATALRCPRSTLGITHGMKSRDKIICVMRLSAEEVLARLVLSHPKLFDSGVTP